MSDAANLDAELFREIMLEMIRRGIVTDEIIGSVERRFEAEARSLAGNSRAERYEQLAHMARLLPVEAAAPSVVEFNADQRRRHIRLVPDGGNDST